MPLQAYIGKWSIRAYKGSWRALIGALRQVVAGQRLQTYQRQLELVRVQTSCRCCSARYPPPVRTLTLTLTLVCGPSMGNDDNAIRTGRSAATQEEQAATVAFTRMLDQLAQTLNACSRADTAFGIVIETVAGTLRLVKRAVLGAH